MQIVIYAELATTPSCKYKFVLVFRAQNGIYEKRLKLLRQKDGNQRSEEKEHIPKIAKGPSFSF